MKRRLWLIILCLFLSGLFLWTSSAGAELTWIPEAQRVKFDLHGDFKTAVGRKVALHELKSKVIFLNFWAPWCGPCKEEMPAMDRLYAQFHEQGLEVVALTSSSRKDVQKFLTRQAFAFTVAFDPGDSLGARFKT